MAALITLTNLIAQIDTLGAQWKALKTIMGQEASESSPTLGTVQKWAANAQDLITNTVDSYEQQIDMLASFHTVLQKTNLEKVTQAMMMEAVDTLNAHMAKRGPTAVDASITNLSTFLAYYNGGNGGAAYNKMATPDFGDLYFALKGSRLNAAGVMCPSTNVGFNPAASANGLAARQIGQAFAAGDDVDTSKYSAGIALLEVVTTFANGSAPPQYTIVGTDNAGLTTASWSVTLTGNNPTASVSTTITPAVTAQSRQTVAIASSTGIVAGSVLTVNAGLVDEEKIVVEAVGGGPTITAAFQKAHSGGAALTGNSTYTLTPANGARIVHVASITPTVTGTDTGKVRIVARQDRVGV